MISSQSFDFLQKLRVHYNSNLKLSAIDVVSVLPTLNIEQSSKIILLTDSNAAKYNIHVNRKVPNSSLPNLNLHFVEQNLSIIYVKWCKK